MALDILRFVNEKYRSNCFLLVDKDTMRGIAIDPGNPDPMELSKYIDMNGIHLDYVFLTHEHFDHISGVAALREKYDFALVAGRDCSERLEDPRRNCSIYALMDGRGISCPRADIVFDGTDNVIPWVCGDVFFMATPGHSPGSAIYVVDQYLFTGDTLIPGLRTVTKLPGGDSNLVRQSLIAIQERFKSSMIVCPGHGELATLGELNIAVCFQ